MTRKTISSIFIACFLLLQGCSQTTDVEHIANAKSFESQGDYRAAVIEYKSALSKNPQSIESRYALGVLYKALGDLENARKELGIAQRGGYKAEEITLLLAEMDLDDQRYDEVLANYDPQSLSDPASKARLLVLQGLALLGKGELDEAERHFDEALAMKPELGYAYFGKAKRLLALGQIKAAAKAVARALENDPGLVRARLLAADIAFAQGKVEEAERIFREVIAAEPAKTFTAHKVKAQFGLLQALVAEKRLDEALQIADQLDKIVPDNPLPKYFKGIIAYQQGQYDVAEENLLRVVNAWPNHAQSYLLLGAINFAQGELEQADRYLSNYLAAVPSNIRARKLLAATRMKLDRPDQAVEALGPILEQSDQDIRALVMAGSAAVRSGDTALGTTYLRKALKANPNDTTARTELALAYLADSRIDRAIEELRKVAESGDDDGHRADILLALTYLKNGDEKKALETAQKLKAKLAGQPLPYNLLGVVYSQMGKEFEARMSFEKALEIDSGYLPAIINLARLDQKNGRLKEAAERYESVLLADPGNVPVMLELARIAEQMGDKAQAVSWLQEAIKADDQAVTPRLLLAHYYLSVDRLEEAESHFKKARNVAPDAPAVLMVQAMLQAAREQYDQAIATYDELIAKQPENPVPLYQQALVYLAKGDAARAKKVLARAVETGGGYVPATALLARLEMMDGNFAKVQGLVRQVKRAHPESVPALVMEGDLKMGEGKYAEAARLYEKALAQREHVAVIIKLVAAYLRSGREDQAIALMQKWVGKHEDSYQVRMRLAAVYQELGRVDEAMREYEAVVRHYPDDVAALNNLAWLYAEKGDPRGVELAERALRKAKNNPLVLDTYGWALLRTGDAAAAEEALRKAHEARPDLADITYHYAVALVEVGKKEEARRLLQQLLEDPKGLSGGVQAVKALLGRL